MRGASYNGEKKVKNVGQFDMSALVILAPECESMLAPYRRQYTVDGAVGLPAHVTILYPFCDYKAYDDKLELRLEATLSDVKPFTFTLSRLSRLAQNHVLCLEPSQCDELLTLITSVAKAFPNYPPYGGRIALDQIRPHVTIAASPPTDDLAAVEKEFVESTLPLLPTRVVVNDLWLFLKSNGKWQQHMSFRLGGEKPVQQK